MIISYLCTKANMCVPSTICQIHQKSGRDFRNLRTKDELGIIQCTLIRKTTDGHQYEQIRLNKGDIKTSKFIIVDQILNHHIIKTF